MCVCVCVCDGGGGWVGGMGGGRHKELPARSSLHLLGKTQNLGALFSSPCRPHLLGKKELVCRMVVVTALEQGDSHTLG